MERYIRQMALTDFGQEGQDSLLGSSVLVVGCGGLGVPAAIYLAACGVGKIGLMDGDVVSISNLHRQIAYRSSDVGLLKSDVLARFLNAVNPSTEVVSLPFFLDEKSALDWIPQFDVVIDGVDEIDVKRMIDRVCRTCDKPWIYGSADGWEGQLAVLNVPDLADRSNRFHYTDLFDSNADQYLLGNCALNGVLGIVPGIVGMAQALEAIKLLSGKGDVTLGCLRIFDGYSSDWKNMKLQHRTQNSGSLIRSSAEELEWTTSELQKRITGGEAIVWVDVREDHERDYPLPNCIHIPMAQWPDRWAELPSHLPVVVFCTHGNRSKAAVLFTRRRADRPLLRSVALQNQETWAVIPPSLRTKTQAG